MPQIAIAVVAIAAGYAGATAAGFAVGTLAFAVASTVIAGVVTYGLTAAYNAMSGSSSSANKSNVTSSATDRKQLIRSSDAPRVVVYGQARISGPLVYAASSGADQEYLHLVVPLASHQIAGVDVVWINETPVPAHHIAADGEVTQGELAGHVRIRRHLGDQTTADAALMAESPDGWSADHKLLGVAYLYIRLKFSRDLFPSGLQTISAQVRGKLVLDPRTGQTVFSTNWALNVLDYLVSEDGLGCQADELDQASFIAAANLSDEMVQLDAAGTQFHPRYTLDGVFSLDEKPLDIMEGMIGAGCGALTYVQGRYQLHGGAYEVPTATLTTADFLDELELVTKPQRGDLFNAVRGTFIDPSREWQSSEYPAFRDQMFEDEDGERIWREVEFKWTIDPVRCQRLAKQLLRRHRESLSFKVSVRYSAMRFTVWQSVAVTVAELGWEAKVFRLVTWTFDPPTGAIKLTFNEDGAGSYGWLYDQAASIPPSPDTTLISPTKLPVPTNLILTPSTAIEADGSAVPAMELRWTAAKHAFVQAHEVQWRVAGALTWYSSDVALPATSFLIRPVLTGQAIEARVRAIAALVRGPWSAIGNGTGQPDITPPGIAYIQQVVGVTRGISIRWLKPRDTDLAYVEVWEAPAVEGPWGKISETSSDFFVRSGLLPAQGLWFRTRAVDRTGNAGAYSVAVFGQANLLVADDLQNGILNTAKFAAGLTVPEVVDQLPGFGNFEGRLAFLTSNGKLYRFAGGQWTASVPAVDVGGGLTDAQIASIAAAKMTGQIVGTQIADGSISTPKVLAGSIIAGHIAANQIVGAHLVANQIAAQHIIAGNILAGHLGANSVTAGKIDANAVTAGTIQAGAVGADQIAGREIRARHLAVDETLLTTSAQIGTAVIQEAQIGALTVDTIKIKAGAIGNLWVEAWAGNHQGGDAQLLAFAAGDAVYGARWVIQVHASGAGAPYEEISGSPGGESGGGGSVQLRVPGGMLALYVDGTLYRATPMGYPSTMVIWGGVLGAGVRTISVRASTTWGGQVHDILAVAQIMKR